MEIMTADGIRIFCLPDNAICKRMNTSPERFWECPICNFDDAGYICVPELCKEKDGQHNREQIAEEIADVLITIDQLILYHDIYNEVAEWRTVKMNRLRQRVFLEQYG